MSSAQLKKFATIKPAEIEWRDGLPFSTEFDDVYFSVYGAVEESTHVFIDGNHLIDDWKNPQQDRFYIAELGFGSGLNFLNTVSHWKKHLAENKNKSQQHLHYITIEKRPFSNDDFERTCKLWSDFSEISKELLQNYPSQTYGRHQIPFHKWNITLTLMFMPLDDAFNDLLKESASQQNKIAIDHWFLDGFAPTKNESMWGEKNAQNIAKLSKSGTRLTTYSVAASVKKPLVDVGFEITKRKGFAKKREMLTATLKQPYVEKNSAKFINIKHESPWFNISRNSISSKQDKIAIIGGGIAGCTTAYTLSQRSFRCDLFEINSNIAQEASGAAAGIYLPQLTSDMNIGSQFNWLSYLSLLRFLSNLSNAEKQSVILSQGIHRFIENPEMKVNLKRIFEELGIKKWITESNIYPNNQCLHFPYAGIIDIQAYCQILLDKIPHQQLTVKENSKVDQLNFENDHWHISTEHHSDQYKQVIFCGGAKSNLLEQLNITSTNTTRGQTCYFRSESLAKEIKQTLYEKIYLVPKKDNQFHLGATFEDFEDDDLNINSQKKILEKASKLLKKIGLNGLSKQERDQLELKGTLGYRLHATDRMPIVGAATNIKKLTSKFENFGQKRLLRNIISEYNLSGLWINTAYGSHGLLYSLIASQHLASLITNDISPLQNNISNALHPARFLIKSLKRN